MDRCSLWGTGAGSPSSMLSLGASPPHPSPVDPYSWSSLNVPLPAQKTNCHISIRFFLLFLMLKFLSPNSLHHPAIHLSPSPRLTITHVSLSSMSPCHPHLSAPSFFCPSCKLILLWLYPDHPFLHLPLRMKGPSFQPSLPSACLELLCCILSSPAFGGRTCGSRCQRLHLRT